MSKILIIDDDPANRDILRARLEAAGHEVAEAHDGEKGFQLLVAGRPDLVFLDVMMPRVDGWQICRKIKNNAETKAIPVVMLTALSQQIDQLRGYESGADDFMTKPWDTGRLMAVLGKLLPQAKNV